MVIGDCRRGVVKISDTSSGELESKIRKFLCPAVVSLTRKRVTDADYAAPFAHLLDSEERSRLVSGELSLFDLARSKSFGTRIVDKSILTTLGDTVVSLQHMDPNRIHKVRYKCCNSTRQ